MSFCDPSANKIDDIAEVQAMILVCNSSVTNVVCAHVCVFVCMAMECLFK